jgi:hypothetical protein
MVITMTAGINGHAGRRGGCVAAQCARAAARPNATSPVVQQSFGTKRERAYNVRVAPSWLSRRLTRPASSGKEALCIRIRVSHADTCWG